MARIELACPHERTQGQIQRLHPVPHRQSARGTEAARVQPEGEAQGISHDAFTRLLHRLEPDPQVLCEEVRSQVRRRRGVLVFDDSIRDKPYARHMELARRHWSGKHHRIVGGIGLVTLLWTDGHRYIPVDYRIADKPRDGKTNNDHVRDMLRTAYERGFAPECVLFDAWYSSLENLKAALLRVEGADALQQRPDRQPGRDG